MNGRQTTDGRKEPMKKNSINKPAAAMAICLLLCLIFTSCSPHVTPGDQVAKELDAIKSDTSRDTFKQVLLGNEFLPAAFREDYEAVVDRIRDFDYEIKSESFNEDKTEATVVVSITTYDFGAAYGDTYDRVVRDAAEEVITEGTDVRRYVLFLMLKKMLEIEEKSYTAEVEVHCVRNEEGDWVTDIDRNDPLLDAMTGGMMSAIEQIH